MKLIKQFVLVFAFFFFHYVAFAQFNNLIKEVIVRTDSSEIRYPKDTLHVGDGFYLPLKLEAYDLLVEFALKLQSSDSLYNIEIVESTEYDIVVKPYFVNGLYFFKLQFSPILNNSSFKIPLKFIRTSDSLSRIVVLPLFPFTKTNVEFKPLSNELFIGEEKIFEIYSDMPENIKYSSLWISAQGYDYRFSKMLGQLRLHVIPNESGNLNLKIKLQTHIPYLNSKGKFIYELPELAYKFEVKRSRLQFLSIDRKEISFDDEARTRGVEIQIDNSYLLQLNKTYRIENQEQSGGVLIGELFTRSNLANNKVLCLLRAYNFHRNTEGYLYIKDGDTPRFITNISITPKTEIKRIQLYRPGQDWTDNLAVYPGEVVDVRIEGEGLHKSNLRFENAVELSKDSLTRNENLSLHRIRIPIDIAYRTISINNGQIPTGYLLRIKEYQRPRPFDYIFVDYGEKGKRLNSLNKPILYNSLIEDVVIEFNTNKIDNKDKLFGKQYLNLNVRITDKKGQLIEMREIENICICPGDESPRVLSYPTTDCSKTSLRLNDYVTRKTYDLGDWSKIELTIKNDRNKHSGEGESQTIDIYLKKKVAFDIEVSFPAGLLVKQQGENNYNNFSGLSMAMIAQFSFYHPDKIARYRPYRIGAGFLALDAFNFNSNNEKRDLGAVIIGSLYPTTRDVKLTFPLYLGGGYFLGKEKWFFLVGPGINVRF